jgi:ADP-ribose pyrophosphatase YjhB (NUDIX family)
MAADKHYDVQLIANLVVERADGKILFVRYRGDDERWWLPGEDLEPYEHPDERARIILEAFAGLDAEEPRMTFVESFRGRRGWHVVFHYHVRTSGEPPAEERPGWFAPDELPRTMHGRWEHEAVRRVLEDAGGRALMR